MKKNKILQFNFLCLLSLFFSLAALYGQDATSFGLIEGVNYKKNIVYKTVDSSRLVMDILYPNQDKRNDKNPWVLFVHGGGWAGGNKDNIYRTAFAGTLKKLLDEGVVCVTIDYRLAKAPITTNESVIDCKDAAKFLLKNAKQFQLDEENYGVWGGSAGGHLSLVTALVPDSNFETDKELSKIHPKFKFVLSFFPFTSCLNPELRPGSIFANEKLFSRLLGGTLKEKPAIAYLLSPSEFLDENSPPILLVHGDKDTTLPIINSQYMVALAKKKKAKVELLTVCNAGHSLSGTITPSLEQIANHTTDFVLSNFKK